MTVTRFAPSPTGYLHLGHAYSAHFAWQAAKAAAGRFLLRIEDIDPLRCRSEFSAAIEADLRWLGLSWAGPVRYQSAHLGDYEAALRRLAGLGVLYPCFCTRAEIAQEVAHAGAAPHGPEGPRYPGTCRLLTQAERERRIEGGARYALRLDAVRATARAGPLSFSDRAIGVTAVDPQLLGDVVLARKEVPTSYHLAVTVDDALQGVTLVTRGADLLAATHVHRLLQSLLGLPEPAYHHHRLLCNAEGARLAKRDGAQTLRSLRAAGADPADIHRRLAL